MLGRTGGKIGLKIKKYLIFQGFEGDFLICP